MIDFEEIDDADSEKLRFVARSDHTGTSRGECSCCDCLEWLSPNDLCSECAPQPQDLTPHPYNVTRRLEATCDGRRGSSTLKVLRQGAGPAARSVDDDHCARCGCHAMWHEDLADKVAELNERGMLVEAQPGWSDVERALFWQTGGAFQPSLGSFGRGDSSVDAAGGAGKDSTKTAAEEVLVSVVCPTSVERRKFHPSLYSCFNQQRHAAKELIVIETGSSAEPSRCFTLGGAANDPRVIYRYYDDSASPWSIGAKRNLACYLAAGAVIVHFDDDDLYTPGYLGLMVRALQLGGEVPPDRGVEARLADPLGAGQPTAPGLVANSAASGEIGSSSPQQPDANDPSSESPEHRIAAADVLANVMAGSAGVSMGTFMEGSLRGGGRDENPNPPLRGNCRGFNAEAVTFSSWYTFNVATGGFGICDVDNDHNKRQSWTLGYGFTYAYLRDAWSAHWFRDVNLGEDCDFFEALLARDARVVLLRDATGFCAHVHHEANFSPWEHDRPVPIEIVSSALREIAAKLGSGLKVATQAARQRQSFKALEERVKAIILTPVQAASMQDELIAEYTKERFQLKLHESWVRNQADATKQRQERSQICLEVQGPIIERYGFPATFEGVCASMRAFTPEINEHPGISKKNWLIHWLCKPEMQADTPLDSETLMDMIANLTKNAKVRRRRT